MKQEELKDNLFRKEQCPDANQLYAYSKAGLNEEEAWTVESHLNACTLCSDAIEGMLLVSTPLILNEIESGKSALLQNHKTKVWKHYQNNFITAVSVVVISIVAYLYIQKPSLDKKEIAASPVIVAPQNTIANAVIVPEETIVVDENIKENIPATSIEKSEKPKPEAIEISTAEIPLTNEPVMIEKQEESIPASPAPAPADPTPMPEPVPSALTSSAFSVIYLHDFKAIDYKTVYPYYKNKLAPTLRGVSPWMENEYDRKTPETSMANDTIFYADVLDRALDDYSKKNFKTALEGFNMILKIYADDQNALFYSALINYENGNYDESKERLIQVVNHLHSPFEEEAIWYIALNCKELKQYTSSKGLINRIIERNGFYAKEAKEVLKEMK